MQNEANKTFEESLRANVTKFAFSAGRMLDIVMGTRCNVDDVSIMSNGVVATNKCLISILFTGTLYGEYLLALDEDVAASMLGMKMDDPETREMIEDSFRELLNVIVGETVVNLHEPGTKLTVTPPRVTFGSVRYPNFKTGRAVLSSDKGQIECYLYIDRMKLDIAASYTQAMESLQAAHDELKQALAALQMQQVYLVQAEKLAALGTMAAGVAHEINTPLATVSMLSEHLKELMEQDPIDRAEVLSMLDTVEETVQRISVITNGMRAFAHNTQGGQIASTRLTSIVSDMLLSCKTPLKDAGIELIWDANSQLLVECRPSELTHVLLNLVNNAKDAVATLTEKWIRIEANQVGEFVEIRVTDSGAGISDVVRGKVFDPFFTTKAVGKGTGLGLSVSKGILDSHSGTIRIDTTAKNTSFVIRLPVRQKLSA